MIHNAGENNNPARVDFDNKMQTNEALVMCQPNGTLSSKNNSFSLNGSRTFLLPFAPENLQAKKGKEKHKKCFSDRERNQDRKRKKKKKTKQKTWLESERKSVLRR